jgi:uncharacterized phage protein (TIGR01671 family)
MNRPIKFRAWDTKNKRFIDHVPNKEYMLDSDEWDHRDINEEGGIYPSYAFEYYSFKERIVFQQFTGLKDKNEKEIYEGDVAEVNYVYNTPKKIGETFRGVVKFGVCCLSYTSEAPQHSSTSFYIETFPSKNKKEPEVGLIPDHNLCDGYAEVIVIGNVFENPDLLK